MRLRLTRHRYTLLTAAATFCLLLAGGLVTSTDSGLAVPDWPLSYGTLFPPMVGGIRYEHGHRLIAAAVAVMILVLAVWQGRSEPRRWVRRLGYLALGAVLLQALLGGLTVIWLLPPPVSIAHAVLGQLLFCLIVALTWCTAPAWTDRQEWTEGASWPPLGPLSVGVAGLVLAQLILGAVIRHTGYAVFPHIGCAMAVWASAGWVAARAWPLRHTAPSVWMFAYRLAGLVTVQVVLGLCVFVNRGSVLLRTGHVALGALVLAQAVMLAWAVGRAGSTPSEVPDLAALERNG